LVLAPGYNHPPLVRALLDAGADPLAMTNANTGYLTPLDFAINAGNLKIVRMLVEAGAPVNRTNDEKWSTPLGEARGVADTEPGNLESAAVIQYLIENGAVED